MEATREEIITPLKNHVISNGLYGKRVFRLSEIIETDSNELVFTEMYPPNHVCGFLGKNYCQDEAKAWDVVINEFRNQND